MPALVEEGRGPEEHQQRATLVDHPFVADPPLERDLMFTVKATARIGPKVKSRRRARWKLLRRIAKAFRELDDHGKLARHVSIDKAPGVALVLVAYMVVLLK